MRAIVVTAIAASLLTAAGAAAQGPSAEDWKIVRVDRTIEVPVGVPIEIINPYGQVRIRAGADDEMQIVANAQRHAEDPREARIELSATPEGGLVRVQWGEAEGVPDEIPEGWTRRRVDVAVVVPPAARLSIVAKDDLVEGKGTRGAITVRSEAGGVQLRTAGAVDVETESGSVLLQLSSRTWAAPSRVQTRTGDVTAYLRDGLAAVVEIETEGQITTDYSLTVERAPRPALRKKAVAVLGEGGPRMEIRSVRGAVKILELFLLDDRTPESP